jgi:hypothetical protein
VGLTCPVVIAGAEEDSGRTGGLEVSAADRLPVDEAALGEELDREAVAAASFVPLGVTIVGRDLEDASSAPPGADILSCKRILARGPA